MSGKGSGARDPARMLSLGVMTPAVASLQSEFYKRSARN